MKSVIGDPIVKLYARSFILIVLGVLGSRSKSNTILKWFFSKATILGIAEHTHSQLYSTTVLTLSNSG